MNQTIEQRYITGDSRSLETIITAAKIPRPQLILTSPPYFDLLDYGGNGKQIGYGNKSYENYLGIVCGILQQAYDISTTDATLWLVVDTFKKDEQVKLFPFDIVNKLNEISKNTWNLKDIIIWDKGRNLPWHSKGNFKNQHEYILLFSKSKEFKFHIDRVREVADLKKWWKTYPERYNPDGKTPSNIWTFNTPIRGWGENNQDHLCPFPFQLVEKIISICTDEGDWVLDPFTGSGAVLAIAKEMNRHSVGIDVNKQYKKKFLAEVIVGASKYWANRKLELEEATESLKDFKLLNQKLRKLKIVDRICEHINEVNNNSFIYFARDRPKNRVEIIVLENGTIPKVELLDDSLLQLIKQAKVDAVLSTVKDEMFFDENPTLKAYKYRFGKFNSYTATCGVKSMSSSASKYDFIYSDIKVKLNP